MPESKRELRIEGSVAQSETSDAFLTERIDAIRSEIHDISTRVQDAQILGPLPLVKKATIPQVVEKTKTVVENPTHKDSITGLREWQRRIDKKAA